ncbi:excinuclease ABC subunit UvrA [Candidatus Berkelbacteria bacterium]|nr:excinuclease ABC subunit UvrA [Candidatus Berkelbacteria bacterium]
MMNLISIRGARQHNLKNVDLDIPKNKLVVLTGISGSGKSSLAFDTIYAEGQRRYIESLSAYARQFLGQSQKPDVDSIEGLSPAISIDQKSTSHNPRSTVGTVTEIHDYLRLLFAKVGTVHCPNDGTPIQKASIDEVIDAIVATGTAERPVTIFSPLARARKGEYKELLDLLYKEGFSEIEVDGTRLTLQSDNARLPKQIKHTLLLPIDTIPLRSETLTRLAETIEQAIDRSQGTIIVRDGTTDRVFNTSLMCSVCGTSVPVLEPRSFSFNSPFGACPDCDGLGTHREIDRSLVVPDDSKTIAEGAILPWTYSPKNWYGFTLQAVCEYYRIDLRRPLKNMKVHEREMLLDGPGNPIRIPAVYYAHEKRNVFHIKWDGILPLLQRRWRETESEAVRREIEKYMTQSPCASCQGARLRRESLLVTVGEKTIAAVSALPIIQAQTFFRRLTFAHREQRIAERPLREIQDRLGFLVKVGLDYLTLDRSATTLAGGEAQRIRLASQVGSRLTGVLYVLDEPSIGLHARDNDKLIDVLKALRDVGNTVIVVEHDDETILAADHIVDIGPFAGKHGGEIVAQGSVRDVSSAEHSLTGQYLKGTRFISLPTHRRTSKAFLSLYGASDNNLKRVTVHIPLGTLTCVTGVSGSGKSTLVTDVLYNAAARELNRSVTKPGPYERMEGIEKLDRAVLMSQSPIGRTPRSNPATYTGLFGPIRDLFAATKEARVRGYRPGRFSFNVTGGRCEACAGDGEIKIEMQFLPDVYVPCDICHGERYNRETLQVRFAGKTVADVLRLTVEEALIFFEDFPNIHDKLAVLSDVGLGYVALGQSATTLSGGEAQRIKLATELARRGNGRTLYVLDEPTTGLHTYDIAHLLTVLNRLVTNGNTVIVIEHNLDVIKSADWIIDLGPDGGDQGGKVIATGTPETIASIPASYTGQYLKRVLARDLKRLRHDR